MSATTKVDTIIDGIRSRILSGEFGEEGRLPSFRKLVDEYQTSQETMNKAMQALQAEGILLSAGAKGVYVNKPRIRVPALVANFYQQIQKFGYEAMEELLGKPEVITPTNEIAKYMHLSKNEQVLRRFRKQGSKETTFRLADSYYPMSLITDDMLAAINKDSHYNIIDAIRDQSEKPIKHVHEEIIARLPTAFEQEQLKIVRTNPVFEMKVISFATNKKTVIMYSQVVFNANLFFLSYNYSVDQWS